MPRYIATIRLEVQAPSLNRAAAEADDLMEYAFEVSNDAGRFKTWRVEFINPLTQPGPCPMPEPTPQLELFA